MNYQNAKIGFKKLHSAEIIDLIATIIIVASTIGIVLGLVSIGNNDVTTGNLLVTSLSSVALIISLVLGLVAYIINIIGLSSMGKDNHYFKDALYNAIAGLIVVILCSILVNVFKEGTFAYRVVDLANNNFERINEFVTIYLVLKGSIEIANTEGKAELEAYCNSTLKFIIASSILSIILGGIGSFETGLVGIITAIISLASLVIAIIAYVKYLSFLKRMANEL